MFAKFTKRVTTNRQRGALQGTIMVLVMSARLTACIADPNANNHEQNVLMFGHSPRSRLSTLVHSWYRREGQCSVFWSNCAHAVLRPVEVKHEEDEGGGLSASQNASKGTARSLIEDRLSIRHLRRRFFFTWRISTSKSASGSFPIEMRIIY